MIDYKIYLPAVRDYMERAVHEVEARGEMSLADHISMDMLAYYLQEWLLSAENVAAAGIVVESDRGNMSKNPAVDVGHAALKQALAIMQDYGLTPMSRKKLVKGEPKEEEDSPLAEFLRSAGSEQVTANSEPDPLPVMKIPGFE